MTSSPTSAASASRPSSRGTSTRCTPASSLGPLAPDRPVRAHGDPQGPPRGREGLVVRNVADLADPPWAKSTKAGDGVWTAAELAAFLGAMAGEEFLPLWRLTGMTGMRRGEVCGLLWEDVDLDAAQLRVRR